VKTCPAFFYGLYILIGSAFAIVPHWSYIIPLAALSFLAKDRKQLSIALITMVATFAYAKTAYTFPQIPSQKAVGAGIFTIDSLSLQSSPFHRSYVYKGTLSSFTTAEGTTWKNIPCRIYPNLKKGRPKADCDFSVAGVLIEKGAQTYVLKPSSLTPIQNSWSFAEIRFLAKEKLHAYLKTLIPDKQACTFLTSMLTGEIEERVLSLEFNRLGLQHILGVSGFQFVLLASCVGFILRLVFPYKAALILLLCFLTGYFILLGNSPPVQRAWIAISVFLIGMLTNLRCTPLNALGVALIVEVLLYPPVITHIGFQLSFLCTWAILEVYPLMRKQLSRWLPIRPFDEVKKMDLWNQHGYIAASMIRESTSLNFSVHLIALPTLLCLFHKFPLLSLAYNLFFPIGASIVFLLTLLALCFSVVFPPLGTLLSLLCNTLTSGLLNLVSHPPAIADIYIRVQSFPLSLVVIFLTLGCCINLSRYSKTYFSNLFLLLLKPLLGLLIQVCPANLFQKMLKKILLKES